MTVEALIARWGLPALLVGAGVEGETVVVLGGIAAHHGLFGYGPAVAAAATGSFVADQIFFAIGRRFREAGWVRRMRARPAFARALAAFEAHPTGFVLAFRFLYGLRIVSPLAIGTTGLSAVRFAILNACAALVWALVFVSLGWVFGEAVLQVMGRVLRGAEWTLPVIVLVLGTAAFAWVQRQGARKRR